MRQHLLSQKNKKRFLTTPMLITTTIILIAICFVPLVSSCKPQPQIQITKTGPLYAYAGEEITYTYLVSNIEKQPLSDVTVTDNRCGPATYVSGDENHNNKLDHAEIWTFTCTTNPAFTFPNPLTNTATAQGTWGDQTTESTAEFTLYPFILRKAVLIYWEGENIDYDDPNTLFSIQMSKGEKTLDVFSLSESTPTELWLSQGIYQFTEINIPDGYLPAYDTITISTGETYPDFSQINIITFDLSVEKSGPETCYPNEQIIYHYIINNDGPASVTPSLLDDLCGIPVYIDGDSDSDGRIDPSETWTYEASYSVNAEPGSIITNTVNVTDAEGANRAPEQWWLGGDTNQSNNVANWSVTVISQPDELEEPKDTNDTQEPPNTNESEEPQDTNESEEPQDSNESQEPEQPEEPTQTTTTTHRHTILYGNIAPIANANGPYSAVYNEEIEFNGSGSYDPDGLIIHYGWSFGDGETANGEKVTHHYSHNGLYQVTLTVIDNLGVTDIDVTNASIIIPNRPPTNPLIAGPGNGTKNTQYSYAFGSIDADNDDIIYHIDWGDGTTDKTEFLPNGQYFSMIHHWDLQGEYTITVTASDGEFKTSSELVITIHETLIADNIAILFLGLLALIALTAILLYPKTNKKNK